MHTDLFFIIIPNGAENDTGLTDVVMMVSSNFIIPRQYSLHFVV